MEGKLMVRYYLVENSDTHVVYEYYPEDKKDKQPGIITIDRVSERIELTTPAEGDFKKIIDEEGARLICTEIFDSLEEIDLEVAKVAGTSYWMYYNHAQRRIVEEYNNGVIKEKGMAAWY
jgi:hypothetical protein